MKNHINLYLSIISIIFLWSSCQHIDDIETNTIVPEKDVFVQNNILHFKDYFVFQTFLDSINQMKDDEYTLWAESIGFQSLRIQFDVAMDRINNCESELEQNELLRDYRNIILMTNDVIKPTVEIKSYSSIVNDEMIYCVGDDYFRLDGDFIYKSNSLEEIKNDIGSKTISKFQYISKDFKTACGTNTKFSNTYVLDKRRCDVSITLYREYFNYGNGTEGFRNYIYYYTVAYKYILGKWRRYDTTITARWGEFEVSVPSYNQSTQTWIWFTLKGGSSYEVAETYADHLDKKVTLEAWTPLEREGDLSSAKMFKAIDLLSSVTTTGIGAYWVQAGCSE